MGPASMRGLRDEIALDSLNVAYPPGLSSASHSTTSVFGYRAMLAAERMAVLAAIMAVEAEEPADR